MPRVVPDQRSKFENEEFFRKLSRECEVRRRRGPPFPPSLPHSSPPPARRGESFRGPRRGWGGAPRFASRLSRGGGAEPRRAGRRGEAQSVHSAAPLSPGLAPPDCAPCSPQIKYTGFRDRPHEERQARFQNACRDGRSEIAFVATGTNLSLQFFPASWQGEQRQTPTREYVDFEREGGKEKHTFKMQMLSLIYATVDDLGVIQRSLNSIGDFLQTSVYLKAPMILNGVCVIWKGWIDLQRLDGMGCLEFDEERAQQEDALAQQAFEEARRRTREFEDRDRSHREEMEVRVSQLLSVTGKKTARP
uniref:Core-binding factor subunit beta n=1 Tax=Accipiter nisus TaxID=211598 RepID=A0A8B9ME61_9AVES